MQLQLFKRNYIETCFDYREKERNAFELSVGDYYLHQGRCVLPTVCLFVCLSVCLSLSDIV